MRVVPLEKTVVVNRQGQSAQSVHSVCVLRCSKISIPFIERLKDTLYIVCSERVERVYT